MAAYNTGTANSLLCLLSGSYTTLGNSDTMLIGGTLANGTDQWAWQPAASGGIDGSTVLALSHTRPGGLTAANATSLLRCQLVKHASDGADSALIAIAMSPPDGGAIGSAFAIGLLIEAGAGWATGIQLEDSITQEWGTNSDINQYWDQASTTWLNDNSNVTGKTRFALGTTTSATDFRVVDSGATQLLTVNGAGLTTTRGRALRVRSTAVSVTAGTDDDVLVFTASGQTLTLPAIATANQRYHVTLRVAGTLTIDGNGTETINGATTYQLTSQYESVILVPVSATDWAVF